MNYYAMSCDVTPSPDHTDAMLVGSTVYTWRGLGHVPECHEAARMVAGDRIKIIPVHENGYQPQDFADGLHNPVQPPWLPIRDVVIADHLAVVFIHLLALALP